MRQDEQIGHRRGRLGEASEGGDHGEGRAGEDVDDVRGAAVFDEGDHPAAREVRGQDVRRNDGVADLNREPRRAVRQRVGDLHREVGDAGGWHRDRHRLLGDRRVRNHEQGMPRRGDDDAVRRLLAAEDERAVVIDPRLLDDASVARGPIEHPELQRCLRDHAPGVHRSRPQWERHALARLGAQRDRVRAGRLVALGGRADTQELPRLEAPQDDLPLGVRERVVAERVRPRRLLLRPGRSRGRDATIS